MALVIDAVATSPTANSYCTEATATTYFESRLYADVWTNAGPDEQTMALVQATRTLNQFVNWQGQVVTNAQPLAWPRSLVQQDDRVGGTYLSSTTFPDFLVKATCEMALALLAEDRLAEQETGLSGLAVDVIRLDFEKADRKDIIPAPVRVIIGSYGRVTRQSPSVVSLVRV